jgi:hypothetical protein
VDSTARVALPTRALLLPISPCIAPDRSILARIAQQQVGAGHARLPRARTANGNSTVCGAHEAGHASGLLGLLTVNSSLSSPSSLCGANHRCSGASAVCVHFPAIYSYSPYTVRINKGARQWCTSSPHRQQHCSTSQVSREQITVHIAACLKQWCLNSSLSSALSLGPFFCSMHPQVRYFFLKEVYAISLRYILYCTYLISVFPPPT